MKNTLFFGLMLLAVLTASKCKSQTSQMESKDLFQLWTHSHEEDSGQAQVYRSSDYDFPPSRGRFSYDIKSDGSFVLKGPGPSDRPESQKGQWQMVSDKTIQLTLANQEVKTFNIISISKDKLVLSLQNP